MKFTLPKKLSRFPAGLALLSTFLAASAQADGVRKIIHSDGRVEFTYAAGQSGSTPVYTDDSGSGSRIYKYKDSSGVTAFSDQTPYGRPYTILKIQCFACDPDSNVNWHRTGLNLKSYNRFVNRSAIKHAVDPALVRAVIHAESGFRADAVSSQGAQGLMQLMPATARELGVSNPMDAEQNIAGGVAYLARMLKKFNGDIELASAAYNAGPNAVDKYNGIPPYRETRTYVERVGILHKRYIAALQTGSARNTYTVGQKSGVAGQ
jgi:soluble lytic murein transglycosylase-like protein